MKTNIFKNLSILIIFGLVVKILGLFNRIILSRVLSIDGLQYYTKVMPIAALFMTVASFSLGPVITQIVAKNITKRPYSNRDLIKKGIITATTTASVVSIIHLIFNYIICHYLLKMDILIKPFLFFIPLYFLQSYTAILKGYLHGHNKLNVYATGQLIEQVIRIVLIYILIIPQTHVSVINGVIAAIISLSIGEICQNIYMFLYIIKFSKLKNKTKIKTEYKEIIKPALSLTVNKLFSAFSMFLEPIIYTIAFSKTGINTVVADEMYAIVHGYVLPLIFTTNFISIAIEGAILQPLTKAYVNKDINTQKQIIDKALILCFIPALIASIIFFYFPKELMYLFYKTTNGSYFLRFMAIPSFIAYFEGVFVSLLISTDNEKKLVSNTIVTNILHLLIIYTFVSIPKFNVLGLIIAFSATLIISTIMLFVYAIKYTTYKIKFKNIFNIILIYILAMLMAGILF